MRAAVVAELQHGGRLALMPILCSMDTQCIVGAAQRAIAFTRTFGHDEQADALHALRRAGVRASTRWMMFSARSCSP